MKAIVVGAGIGGLAAGIALREQGWDVDVLERQSTVRTSGFGLSLAPKAAQALDRLGALEKMLPHAVRVVGGETVDRKGRRLKMVRFTDAQIQARHPMLFTLRPALLDVLLRQLGQKVEANKPVVSADPESGTVVTEDGESRPADLVVGADGANSQVRDAVMPGFRPRPLHVTAARGLVDDDGEMPLGFARLAFGRGRGAGRATCGSGKIYWYMSWREGLEESAETAARHFSDDVVEIVRRTPPDQIRLDPLIETPPASRWHKGRIALVGDSIHTMAPHAGQGACQALEDAVALGGAVSARQPLREILEQYEKARRGLSEKAVQTSRRNARVILMRNPIACLARDLALRAVPKAVMVRGFGGIQARVS